MANAGKDVPFDLRGELRAPRPPGVVVVGPLLLVPVGACAFTNRASVRTTRGTTAYRFRETDTRRSLAGVVASVDEWRSLGPAGFATTGSAETFLGTHCGWVWARSCVDATAAARGPMSADAGPEYVRGVAIPGTTVGLVWADLLRLSYSTNARLMYVGDDVYVPAVVLDDRADAPICGNAWTVASATAPLPPPLAPVTDYARCLTANGRNFCGAMGPQHERAVRQMRDRCVAVAETSGSHPSAAGYCSALCSADVFPNIGGGGVGGEPAGGPAWCDAQTRAWCAAHADDPRCACVLATASAGDPGWIEYVNDVPWYKNITPACVYPPCQSVTESSTQFSTTDIREAVSSAVCGDTRAVEQSHRDADAQADAHATEKATAARAFRDATDASHESNKNGTALLLVSAVLLLGVFGAYMFFVRRAAAVVVIHRQKNTARPATGSSPL